MEQSDDHVQLFAIDLKSALSGFTDISSATTNNPGPAQIGAISKAQK